MGIDGVWLPIVTPFVDGRVDFKSYGRMIENYVSSGISGIMPLGTTGEVPVIDDAESEEIIARTMEMVNGRVPVYAGVGGNSTQAVLKKLKTAAKHGVDGILSVCPYYNRPGQEGLFLHFKALAEAGDLPIIIYNIPYRTGVNLSNDTLIRLSELENITGVKDSSGDIAQSLDLLARKPEGFSVMTGEDHLFFTSCVNGGDGGIMASSHINTGAFLKVFELIQKNDHKGAFGIWKKLAGMIPLLFAESNPAPLKYCLWRMGVIESPDVRLPMVGVSGDLKIRLDRMLDI